MLPCSFKIQGFTLINLLLKLRSSTFIYFNIQIEKLSKILFSMVFKLNHQQFFSSLSYAKFKYFYIFPRHSNSLDDLVMVVYLIIEPCMKLKLTLISEDIAH